MAILASRPNGLPHRMARGPASSASHPGATLATEMEAAVWTAIAILAAMSVGTLFYLGARIDSLAESTASRFDSLASRMDARFAAVDARFDAVDARFDALIGRLDTRFDRIDSRFDHIDERFDALAARLDAHLDRHAG